MTNPVETMKFESLPISSESLQAISDMGFSEATPIQYKCITYIQSGRDVLGQSQTGTGKTAAFGIPLLEKVDPDERNVQAVILCPTRELAIQISEEFNKLLRYRKGIRVLPVYGGQPIERQISALKKGIQVVVGTPGRVMDHMERRTLRFNDVNSIVLDEADEMLDMGFREDIEFILDTMPKTRQTLLFSATMPKAIMDLTKQYQQNPKHITVVHKSLTLPCIEQVYYEIREPLKFEALCRLIDMEAPPLALVFCNTKKRVDEISEKLQSRGYFAEALHGDLKQSQRDMVMKKFRSHTLEVLVATDVAARGIDVDDIAIVFNYDLPQDEEYYIHRIGRTGRAGKQGKAITFAAGRDLYRLREIMHYAKIKVAKGKMPTLKEIEEVKTRQFTDKLKGIIDEGYLDKYKGVVEAMSEYNPMEIAAALFKMNLYDDTAKEIIFEEPKKPRLQNGKQEFSKRDFSDDKNMARLYLTVGKKDMVKPGDIVGAITGEAGVPGKSIGHIDIYEEFTFVDIPKKIMPKVLNSMSHVKIKGKKIKAEWARPKRYSKNG